MERLPDMTPKLEAAYAEAHRFYHTGAHIRACLAELAGVAGLKERQRRMLVHSGSNGPRGPTSHREIEALARETDPG